MSIPLFDADPNPQNPHVLRAEEPHEPIRNASSADRRDYFGSLVADVFIPLRQKLLAYTVYTTQSAQVDCDGYFAQTVAAIVLGVPGNYRRGKTGKHDGDLSDGTEVKSAYRAEQMNGMEDSHINFGQITPKKMQTLMDRERIVIVHTAYDVLGRIKIEVLGLNPRSAEFVGAVNAFHERSSAKRPQFQPRLYPDGKRDVLRDGPDHFVSTGARLLARAVVDGDAAVVDKWAPDGGLPLSECLDLAPSSGVATTPHVIRDPRDPDEFFETCMVQHRHALVPYCNATGTNQNVGFSNLSQHLVSVVTGIRGTGSGARGYDLADTSEIKLAMGIKGDDLGTEDYPRLNLQSNVPKILGWKTLYPVRLMSENGRLRVKVFRPDMDEFREQVRDYFSVGSKYENSANIQYHAPKTFEENTFTGNRSDGTKTRLLTPEVIYCAIEQADGSAGRCPS